MTQHQCLCSTIPIVECVVSENIGRISFHSLSIFQRKRMQEKQRKSEAECKTQEGEGGVLGKENNSIFLTPHLNHLAPPVLRWCPVIL